MISWRPLQEAVPVVLENRHFLLGVGLHDCIHLPLQANHTFSFLFLFIRRLVFLSLLLVVFHHHPQIA